MVGQRINNELMRPSQCSDVYKAYSIMTCSYTNYVCELSTEVVDVGQSCLAGSIVMRGSDGDFHTAIYLRT